MKILKKVMLVSLVCTLFVAIFTVTASAKTYTGTKYGYHSDYIYVHTTKENAQIPLTFTKGNLESCMTSYDVGVTTASLSSKIYASYEIKIYYWNGKQYVKETSYDVYNKASNTVTLKRKNADYKIQVYQWKAETTFDSYVNKGKIKINLKRYIDGTAGWSTLPKFSTGTLKNCTMYSKNPH